MAHPHHAAWTWVAPLVSWGLLLLCAVAPPWPVWVALLCVGLLAGVMAAVHHAEVIAAKVGEPFGTLVLALSVTVIEVALMVIDDAVGRPCAGHDAAA